MPENDQPASNAKSEVTPDEFDFAKLPVENPRVKKRSLKPKRSASLTPAAGTPPAARDLEREAPSLSAEAARPEYQPPEDEDAVDFNPGGAVPSPARPRSDTATTPPTRPAFASTARPSASAASKATSPHGTRPATLYYSTAPQKEKETAPPMKTTTASPSSSTTQPGTAATRPASVVDYRTNIDRQAREQKSVGGVLSILVYTLIGFFVIGAALAGYGAYVVHQALHDQDVNVSQLDARYSAINKDFSAKLATTQDSLTQAQAQIDRQQDLILKQQEAITKLMAATDKLTAAIDANAAALRTERSTRADETSSLRARLRDLEYHGPTTQKY